MMIVEGKARTADFRRHHGFRPDPLAPLQLFAPLVILGAALGLT